jgi:ribosomal protein S18 acetylase RimI-like enzyme
MHKVSPANPRLPSNADDNQRIQPLNEEHKTEVLNFLNARPLHTFMMSSWIKDNGLVSSLNRGTFYGYRDASRELQGVALIGHVTLFETKVDSALAAFAALTYNCPSAHAVLSESNKISRFVSLNATGSPAPRRVCRELLLEKRTAENLNLVQALRPASPEELELVVPIHAQTAWEESGINPLDVDPTGFKERCARRIQQGRVWVSIEKGRLKFKADIVSNTSDVVYLEGVYVSAEHRGNGYGARCLTQLTNHLLERTNTVCMLVNETNSAAQKSYQKAGYQFREHYDTLYLSPQWA